MPAERTKRAPARTTAHPTATRREKGPSAMAKTISDSATTLPPKVLQEQQDTIAATFKAAATRQAKVVFSGSKILYEGRKKLLEKKIKALETDVRQDWKCGYEEQHDMMLRICDFMTAWCRDIFAVVVVQGARKELGTAHKSLVYMKGVVQRMIDTNCRSPFEEDWSKEYIVIAPDGEVQYQETSMFKLLLKLWRDMALTAIDMGGKANEKLVAQMVGAASKTKKAKKNSYRDRSNFTLEDIVRPVEDTTTDDGRRDEWEDGWYSEEMKAAVPKLREAIKEWKKLSL